MKKLKLRKANLAKTTQPWCLLILYVLNSQRNLYLS